VVLPTFTNAVFAECLQGIERAARARDYAVVLTATDYQADDEDDACERLLSHRVDGLILTVANAAKSRLLDRLERERVATVLVYNPMASGRRLTVSVDNRAAAREAVEHLIALGHRRIAMLAGTLVASDRAAERYRGYSDALRAAGLAARPAVEMPSHTENSLDVLRALFVGREAPTALFCSNDLLAIAVLRDLRALALRVPDDVSLVGFDGIAFGQYVDPALTTIEQPSREMGVRALDLLALRLEGQRGLEPVQLPHRLRTGQSTRAVEAAQKPARRKR
jgi:DNA-binding LacI/PurR family transcriptional regulator